MAKIKGIKYKAKTIDNYQMHFNQENLNRQFLSWLANEKQIVFDDGYFKPVGEDKDLNDDWEIIDITRANP